MDLHDVKQILDEINGALVTYDPVLKEKARDLLLQTAFGSAGAAPTAASAAVAERAAPEADEQAAEAVETQVVTHGAPGVEAPKRRRRRPRVTSFQDLLQRWRPTRASEKALLGAYYNARYSDSDTITSQAINAELKRNDLEVSNITRAIETNTNANPPLMEQLEKRGTTKQARKHYRITAAGINFVQDKLYSR